MTATPGPDPSPSAAHAEPARAGGGQVTHLLVIRHGQSEWNALGRGHGWGDAPLSQLGREQAQAAVDALSRQKLQPGVVASDLQRAVHTARIIAEALELHPVTTDRDLREHNIGEWDGLTWDEIEQRWPGSKGRWVREEMDRAPGGESRADFHARVGRAIRRAARDQPGTRRLVVAHGGVVRALEALAGVERHAIAFLSGRWFTWADGALHAGDTFLAAQPVGHDF
jgi:glucosyl-3-phosphoglycerate phosphatase